jgi:non-specific serine/threonine protein kinase
MTHVDTLAAGTEITGYTITGLIGQGGFGVVYLARDSSTGRTVAIKEYLPAAIAGRVGNGHVAPRGVDMAAAYASGLKGFLREARLLSELSHPALVAVHRAWEQNGTAYMAMNYYPGKTLRDIRLAQRAVLTEADIKSLMMPVFDAVAELHAHRVIHRDISPDNILVMANGATVLLDLGSARQVLGGMTQALTTILKPGFAPIEQYVEDGSMEQGRWTDVYGLGAVMYFLATGQPPTPATTRIVRDSLPAISRAEYSANFVGAVTKALAVRAIGRYKSIGEFREALGWAGKWDGVRAETALDAAPEGAVDNLSPKHAPRNPPNPNPNPNKTPQNAPLAAARASEYQSSATSGKTWLVTGVVVALVLAAAWFLLRRS